MSKFRQQAKQITVASIDHFLNEFSRRVTYSFAFLTGDDF